MSPGPGHARWRKQQRSAYRSPDQSGWGPVPMLPPPPLPVAHNPDRSHQASQPGAASECSGPPHSPPADADAAVPAPPFSAAAAAATAAAAAVVAPDISADARAPRLLSPSPSSSSSGKRNRALRLRDGRVQVLCVACCEMMVGFCMVFPIPSFWFMHLHWLLT